MIQFEPQASRMASQLERGDKYDRSVVFLLENTPATQFLVEKRDGRWIVTSGKITGEESQPKEVSDAGESKTKRSETTAKTKRTGKSKRGN